MLYKPREVNVAFCAKCKMSAKSETRGGEKIKKKTNKKFSSSRLTRRTCFCLRLTWLIKPVMEAIRSQSCALSSLSSRNLHVIGHWPLGRVNFVSFKSRCFLWFCLMKHWDISPDQSLSLNCYMVFICSKMKGVV